MKTALKLIAIAPVLGIAMLLSAPANSQAQTLEDAQRAIVKLDYNKAEQILREMIMDDPKEVANYYWLGMRYIEQALEVEDPENRTELLKRANQAFENGLDYRPRKYPNIYVGKAFYLTLVGNYPEAKPLLEKALEINPSDMDLAMDVARVHRMADNREADKEAEKLLILVETKQPKNPETYVAKGDLYFDQSSYELALDAYRRALELNDQYVRAYYRIGVMRIKEKKYEEGIEAFNRAIELDPNYPPAYRDLGELYTKAGQYTKAVKYYEKYLSMVEDTRSQVLYSTALYLNEEYDKALQQIQRALQDTTTKVMLRLRGYCQLEIGKPEAAMQSMNIFFEQAPESFYIAKDYIVMAKIHRKLEQYDKAADYYYQAAGLDSSQTDLYNTVAKMYQDQDMKDKARQAWLKSLEVNPNTNDYYRLGLLLAKMERYEEADSILRIVAERSPKFIYTYVNLARIAYNMDPEYDKGLVLEPAKKVVELGQEDPEKYKGPLLEAYRFLSFYYYQVEEDKEKALEHYEKILDIIPDDPKATEMANYLRKVLNMPPRPEPDEQNENVEDGAEKEN